MDLETRIKKIEERNQKVEADKAWETSAARRALILLATFVFAGLYLTWLGVNRPWLNAVVPALGFLLSTLAMARAKDYWLSRRK